MRKATNDTLQELYNLLVVSTASGLALLPTIRPSQETYMKVISGGAGLGVGVKEFRVIFVFESPKALTTFLDSGWSGSGRQTPRPKREVRRCYVGGGRCRSGYLRLPDH